MTNTPKIWRGAVGFGDYPCDECGGQARELFQIFRAAWIPSTARTHGMADATAPDKTRGKWACRSCVLDPARAIAVVDRRGDTLDTPESVAHELDAQIAITIHLENRDHAGSEKHPGIDHGEPLPAPPLPAAYVHVLAVLDKLAHADHDFATTITDMRARYEQSGFFGPKQMLLIQWRLSKHSISHDPAKFVVSIRSDKEISQVRGFDDWRRKKLAPFLSWRQRSRFGF